MEKFIKKINRKFYVLEFKIYSFYLKIKSYIKYYFGISIKLRRDVNARIKIISPKKDLNNYKKVFIFVSFSEKLSASSKCLLKTLNECKYGIVHVNNKKTSKSDIEFLVTINSLAIDRVNLGRDFGAYKDIFLYLNQNDIIPNLEYLGFVNDSIQFIPGKNGISLKKQILNFEQTDSFGLFTHKSYQISSHYQSFFKILKKEIFNKKSYKNFWKKYKSLDYKQHLIENGEIALSTLFYNSIKNPTVLYSTTKFAKSIISNTIDNFGSDLKQTSIKSFFPSLESKLLKGVIEEFPSEELLKSREILLKDIYLYKEFQFALFQIIENSNPTHVAAFLYPLFLECPFIKKDLALSGSYSIGQCSKLYQSCLKNSLDLGNANDKELFSELAYEYDLLLFQKGNPFAFKNKKFEYFKLGLI